MLPTALTASPFLGHRAGSPESLRAGPCHVPWTAGPRALSWDRVQSVRRTPADGNHPTSSPFADKARGGSVAAGRWGCRRFPRSSVCRWPVAVPPRTPTLRGAPPALPRGPPSWSRPSSPRPGSDGLSRSPAARCEVWSKQLPVNHSESVFL